MTRLPWLLAPILGGVVPGAAQTPPCCTITAIQAATAMVTAKVNANGNTFQFKVTNARTLATLKVNQAVYANFTTHQVSIDGRSACCTVASGPTPPGTALHPAAPANSVPNPQAGGRQGGSSISLALPSVTYGAPEPASKLRIPAAAVQLPRYDSRVLTTVIAGSNRSTTIVHLRGLDGIERAPDLPDGLRRLLKMHVRTLPIGESDHYIVNLDLAKAWFAAHPVPPDIQPTDEDHNTHSGCNKWTWHCVGEVVAHTQQQTEQLIAEATGAWHHAIGELDQVWKTVDACFADATISAGNVPVQFSIAPGIDVDLSHTAKTSSTSVTVKGSAGLSFPIKSDFSTQLDLFYIPCLPFVVRPRSISAGGTFTVGEDLKLAASASGSFDKTFTIPPTGGPRIPIEVIPIVIAGIPVAEMDVSAYIEGDIEVGGTGEVDARLEVKDPHSTAFQFRCDGHGCVGDGHPIPDPLTTTESAGIKGTVFVRPDIYTALQLDFDVDAFSVRAGPQPYLLGQGAGCVAGTATQSSGGASTSSENHVLAADLDWGIDLRAEALVAGKVVGNSWRHSFTANKHLWWSDLAPGGSTALDALAVAAPAVQHRATAITVRMPSCYPYSNAVQYRISWSGSAAATPNSSCQWQGSQGVCLGDPQKGLTFALTWPTSGSYAVTVTAYGDQHDHVLRVFIPTPAPHAVTVNVAAGP